MKRIVSVLLVLIMLFAMSGCKREIPMEEDAETANTQGNTTTDSDTEPTISPIAQEKELLPEEGAKLTFWTGDVAFAEAIAKNFEAKYGVPVTVEEVGLGAIDKIALSGPAGTGADVFMSPHDSFQHGVTA